jgi:hypothetical protein
MVRSKKTGLDYPEPQIPSQEELERYFYKCQVGDIVILYIQYKDDLYSLHEHLVTKVTETHVFITHVKQGFALVDGKAKDRGKIISHWQLLPYTEELQIAARHALLVDKAFQHVQDGMQLISTMSAKQLADLMALFNEAENQNPPYPLVQAKRDCDLKMERQKVLQDAMKGESLEQSKKTSTQ